MNKTAMITGASRGLGKEFAIQLAAKKYALILVARNVVFNRYRRIMYFQRTGAQTAFMTIVS